MWLRSWFKRLAGKWFGRRLAASIAPRRRCRKQPAARPELDTLEDRYAPAMLAALRQMKDLYLDIKVTDASVQELAMLNELQSLGLSRVIGQGAGLEGLAALQRPGKPQPALASRAVETWRPPSRRPIQAATR